MKKKKMMMMMMMVWRFLVILLQVFVLTTCDIDKDKQKCANDLVGLATCLPYVSGDSKIKSPPVNCCANLKQVIQKSPECICLLVKDRNDPSLGLKISPTLALSLPTQCHSPANVTDCIAVLHLPPNSPDAKVFQDFANSGNNPNSSSPASSGSDGDRSTTPTAKTANLNSSDESITIRAQIICALMSLLFLVASN